MASADGPRPASKSALGVIFMVLFLDLIGFGIILPILPFLGLAFHATPLGVGALLAIYSLMQFVFAPFWGHLSDRIGRRPVILASSALMAVSLVAFGLAPNYWVLLAARGFAGFAGANIGVAQAYVADVTTPENRAKGMGMVGAAIGLGFVIGPAMGAFLSTWGLSAPAFAAAGLGFVNVVFAYFRLREPDRKDSARAGHRFAAFDPKALARTFSRPVVGPFVVLNLLLVLGFSAMESTFALFLNAELFWSERETGFLFFYVGIVIVVVQGALIGPLVRRFGERHLLTVGLVGMGLALAALPFSTELTLLLITVGALAAANGLANPSLSSLVSRAASGEEQGQVLGVFQGAASLGRAIGPMIGNAAFAFIAPGAGFLAGAMLMGVALVAAIIAFTQDRGSTGTPATDVAAQPPG